MDVTMRSVLEKSARPAATAQTSGIQFFCNEYISLRQPRRAVQFRDMGTNTIISAHRMPRTPDIHAVSSGLSYCLDWKKPQLRPEADL